MALQGKEQHWNQNSKPNCAQRAWGILAGLEGAPPGSNSPQNTGVSSPPLRERQILGTWAGLLGGVRGGRSAEIESQCKSSDFMAKNDSCLPPNQESDPRWSPRPETPQSGVKNLALTASSEPRWTLIGTSSGLPEVEFPYPSNVCKDSADLGRLG